MSLTSALVGTGFFSIEASIWVTTMKGLPASRHFFARRFWTAGSVGSGTAFPRSPLAITISSAAGISSSMSRTPSVFSILAKSLISGLPASSRALRTAMRSSLLLTKGCITAVTP